jgi:hypothetical protein
MGIFIGCLKYILEQPKKEIIDRIHRVEENKMRYKKNILAGGIYSLSWKNDK